VREGNSGADGGWIRAKARGSFAFARVRGGPAGPSLGWPRHARPRPGSGRTSAYEAGPLSERAAVGCWARLGGRRPFLFLKQILNISF
jgi:hypothetical protein